MAETKDKKDTPQKKSLSMHENVGYWCDVCCCEAEDRWRDLAEQFDIDLSDYEK